MSAGESVVDEIDEGLEVAPFEPFKAAAADIELCDWLCE